MSEVKWAGVTISEVESGHDGRCPTGSGSDRAGGMGHRPSDRDWIRLWRSPWVSDRNWNRIRRPPWVSDRKRTWNRFRKRDLLGQ